MIAVIFEGRVLLKKNPKEYDLVLEKQQQVWEEKKKKVVLQMFWHYLFYGDIFGKVLQQVLESNVKLLV